MLVHLFTATLVVIPTLAGHIELARRQSQSDALYYPASCSAFANAVNIAFQYTGKAPALCDQNSDFQKALVNLKLCIALASPCYLQTEDTLNQGISYCNQFASVATASVATLSTTATGSAAITPSSVNALASAAELFSSACGNCSQITIESVSVGNTVTSSVYNCPAPATAPSTTSSTAAPTSSTATTATSQTSSTSTPEPTEVSGGAIAGIAVGSTASGLLILFGVGIWVFRRRRQHKKSQAEAATRGSQEPEKAQLHSDDYHPPRDELPGSKVPQKVRVVGGMSELDNTSRNRVPAEMSSNEPAASEMKGDLSPATDSSTLVGSSTRHSRYD